MKPRIGARDACRAGIIESEFPCAGKRGAEYRLKIPIPGDKIRVADGKQAGNGLTATRDVASRFKAAIFGFGESIRRNYRVHRTGLHRPV